MDFNSQYDGQGGRPAAHLLIAWPHGVHVVDAMVEAFHADGNIYVGGEPGQRGDAQHNSGAPLPLHDRGKVSGAGFHASGTCLPPYPALGKLASAPLRASAAMMSTR